MMKYLRKYSTIGLQMRKKYKQNFTKEQLQLPKMISITAVKGFYRSNQGKRIYLWI